MKVLLVIDYQNDFVTGALGFGGADKIDEKIALAVEKAYECGMKIIATRDTHNLQYMNTWEGRKLPIVHCVRNTDGWNIFGKTGEVMKNKDIIYIDKPAFGSVELIDVLRKFDISEVNICGVVTNMCVISNAVIAKAACTEAEINIIEPLCLSNDMEMHKKAIDIMASMQMNIKESIVF